MALTACTTAFAQEKTATLETYANIGEAKLTLGHRMKVELTTSM